MTSTNPQKTKTNGSATTQSTIKPANGRLGVSDSGGKSALEIRSVKARPKMTGLEIYNKNVSIIIARRPSLVFSITHAPFIALISASI